jgi:outer membrane protein OmpA-like peptidoglycan-associated protein
MKRVLGVLAAATGGMLLSSPALAFDGHGVAVNPGQGEQSQPLVVWYPWSASARSSTAGLVFEYADESLVENSQAVTGGPVTQTPLVANLVSMNLSAGFAAHERVGVGLGMPLYLTHTGPDGQQGLGLGDARLWVPVGLVLPDSAGQGLGLSVVPELIAPLGDEDSYLGRAGVAGGGSLVAGYGGDLLRAGVNVGLRAGASPQDADALDANTDLTMPLGAAVSFTANPRLALTLEAWGEPALNTSKTDDYLNTAELALSGRLSLPKDLNLVVGTSKGLGRGAGTPNFRLFAGLTWGRRDIAGPELEPVSEVPEVKVADDPYDLKITARDDKGKGVDAEVLVEGEGESYATSTGRDGETILQLRPGDWDVTVSGEGLGTQTRSLELDEDRFVPAEIEAVLHEASGEGQLSLVLTDPEDSGVEGARVAIDGQDYGSTGNGGTLRIEGVAEGDHEVVVDAGREFEVEDTYAVATGASPTRLVLERPAGSVKVRVRTADNDIVGDAQIRFLGPESMDPAAVGPTGEQSFVLEEGDWTVLVSSEAYGVQERQVVVDPLRKVLQVVDVVLTEVQGTSELRLTVLDPDGQPVPGVKIRLDGEAFGRTSNGGSFAMGGLAVGAHELQLEGERFQPREAIPVELVEGTRELVVTMDWLPGTLQVVTRGKGEIPVDAMVRFEGPESLAPAPVGADGEEFFELAPGTWTVGVSASSFGLQVREVLVVADETSLIVVSAVLLEDRGDARLALNVLDPRGRPVEGARIALDGEPVGATSTGGSLTLEGLAPGDSTLEVVGSLFEYKTISPLQLDEGDNELDTTLNWLAGTVSVRTTSAQGPVDALVRAYGPAVLPPVRLGPDGERILYLEPGGWTVVASSETYGIEQEDVAVEPGQEAMVAVEFQLEVLDAGDSAFVLAIQDVDGKPVAGATVQLGDQDYSSPEGGTVVLEDTRPGTYAVSVSAPGYQSLGEQQLTLVEGNQTRTLTLGFVDQPVAVTVQTDKGKAVEAELRFVGPEAVDTMKTDAQGQLSAELRPGEWTVVAQAPELGAGRAEFVIEPGVAPEGITIQLKDTRVEVGDTQVAILEQVQFETGRATISTGSYALLDEVANVLLLNPQIVRVEVQGHTDNVGTDETNQKLSQRRANAVRDYLVDKGVKKSRLVAQGYGASEPLGSNDTEAGRKANRRVQFEITETDERKK